MTFFGLLRLQRPFYSIKGKNGSLGFMLAAIFIEE